MLPTSRNLLTRPYASSKTTNSFFLGFSSKYKYTRLCFFKFFSAATEWSSSSWTNLLLMILNLYKGKLLTDLTRDLHKPQPVEIYWHDHMQAPRPRTPSFLDSPANTSTPTCISLSTLVQQLNDHQALNEISFLIILSMYESNHL